jgi:hypothetical protein
MNFQDLKIGQHLWVLFQNELLMVVKFDNEMYYVCGAWECGINPGDCKIIELVKPPIGYENVKMYYNPS